MMAETIYRIRVSGWVSPEWSDWLGGMQIIPGEESLLIGPLPDDAALYGILNHLAALNLSLIAVERVAENCLPDQTGSQYNG